MRSQTSATGLVQTWVPVTDEQGRTRLQAQWTAAPTAPTHASQAA